MWSTSRVLVFVVLALGISIPSSWFSFFKQKMAYELRIIDWSSDVCSSDLYVQVYRRFFAWLADEAPDVDGPRDLHAIHVDGFAAALERAGMRPIHRHVTVAKIVNTLRAIEADRPDWIALDLHERQNGSTACRGRGCQNGCNSGVAR